MTTVLSCLGVCVFGGRGVAWVFGSRVGGVALATSIICKKKRERDSQGRKKKRRELCGVIEALNYFICL